MTFYTLLLINLDFIFLILIKKIKKITSPIYYFIFEKEVSKTLPNKFKYQLAKDLDHEVAFSQALLGIG